MRRRGLGRRCFELWGFIGGEGEGKPEGLIDTRRWILGGQSEQNIVKCSWPSGNILFATRGGGVDRAGIRASGGSLNTRRPVQNSRRLKGS